MHQNVLMWLIIHSLAQNLVDRKISTYDLEGVFGQLVHILGFKPDAAIAMAVMRSRVYLLMWFRETHFRGWTVPASAYSAYDTSQINQDVCLWH